MRARTSCDDEAKDGGDDHSGVEPGVRRCEADRDQRLTDRDDHDQPVPLDEVGRFHAPAGQIGEQRPEEPDGERGDPEDVLESAVDEPGREDESAADEGGGRRPQDRPQEIRIAARGEREQRAVHDVDDEECNAEQDTVIAERRRDRKRRDEHGRHRHQHRREHKALVGIDRIRQPGVGSPRPPERGEDQQPLPEPTPRRIVQQHPRDLRERQDEDEVEEKLERSDAVYRAEHGFLLDARARTARACHSGQRYRRATTRTRGRE